MESLNDKAPTTLYHQLKEIIARKIEQNQWQPGEKIPTEYELCEKYKVSRITVRQALGELVQEGRLIRKQGKGTFVSLPKIEQNLVSFYSFSEEFKKRGFIPKNKVLEFSTISPPIEIAQKLCLKPGEDQVYFIKRLRYADELLMAIEDTWLPLRLFLDLTKEKLEDMPLYDIMREEYNVVPDSGEESFGAIAIDDKQAKLFGLKKGAAALDIERTAFSGQTPVEYTLGVVRGDKFRFNVRLVR